MNKIYSFLLVLCVLAFNFSLNAQNCEGRYQTDVFASVDVTTVQFGTNIDDGGTTRDLFMDIYQGVGDTGVNRPVVLLTFGGSFSGGSRNSSELVFMATELAKKGYVCASIDYRVTSNPINILSEKRIVKVVFGAVQDGKAAIRYFRQDAATTDTYKINPDQIFIGGTSAGGILAMNLAYVNDISLLPANWQDWADEIGGLEGSSGNPGYCSYVNGVFGFAGAVGDTAYIDDKAVPWYGSHATGDQTVLFGFGPPWNGFAPVSLYGSGNVESRMNKLGIYNHLDVSTGGDHPPLAGSNAALIATKDSLAVFLYNILDCNPGNLKNANQRDCSDITSGIGILPSISSELLQLFPNPATDLLQFNIDGIEVLSGHVISPTGQKVITCTDANIASGFIQLNDLPAGLYILQLHANEGTVARSFVVE